MLDWLKKRLTPVKRKIARWTELAETLQEYWQDNFDEQATSLNNARNVFSADKEDLQIIIAELGDFFRNDISNEDDWPIHILWRRLELQGKETEELIQRTLRRKFQGLNIQWSPLYAHKTDDYGTNFKTAEDIAYQGLDASDFFLTSRGKIALLSPDWDQGSLTYDEFLAAVNEEVKRILPLHIVFDGVSLIASIIEGDQYFGGVVTEGVTTSLSMSAFVYPEELVMRAGGAAATGTTINITEEE